MVLHLSDFHNVPPGRFLKTFLLHRGHNEETKSVEFAFVAICLRLTHIFSKMPVLYVDVCGVTRKQLHIKTRLSQDYVCHPIFIIFKNIVFSCSLCCVSRVSCVCFYVNFFVCRLTFWSVSLVIVSQLTWDI